MKQIEVVEEVRSKIIRWGCAGYISVNLTSNGYEVDSCDGLKSIKTAKEFRGFVDDLLMKYVHRSRES